MKNYRIIKLLFLLSILGSTTVLAEDNSFSNETFGIIDAIYSEESRIVINDSSVLYNYESRFFKANGDSISNNIKRALPKGTPVIYEVVGKPPVYTIKGLKIISMSEYKSSQRTRD